jgi:coproporphyrinogen III oxidase-like Fe-S oxidoreductase
MYYFLYNYLLKKGYNRTSVWAFKKKTDTPRYSSVTRENYLGFGPSAGSYYGSLFTLNTFSVPDYINAINAKGEAVALQMPFKKRLSILYDFYWRLYDTYIPNSRQLSEIEYNINDFAILKTFMRIGRLLRMLEEKNGDFILTKKGAFWIHLLQNYFSLRYINKIWSVAKREAWPDYIDF